MKVAALDSKEWLELDVQGTMYAQERSLLDLSVYVI